MRGRGDRVLIFSQFVIVLDILERQLEYLDLRFVRLDGSTPVVDRQSLVDEFQTDTRVFAFLLSTRAGGFGINLTVANVVIIHDLDFNPQNDRQAEDRCHRVGQTREVRVIRLVARGTIEERIYDCATLKLKLNQNVTENVGDDASDGMLDTTTLSDYLKAEARRLQPDQGLLA